jgi:RNA 3'-terminal phosphate cyclase (ATP)
VQAIRPLRLAERRAAPIIQGISAVANLDPDIAERQKRQALRRLLPAHPQTRIKTLQLPAHDKGTLLLLHASYPAEPGELPAQGCYYALGERGKPAEQVANEALEALLGFIETDATLDHYLADQLLLPLAFASGPSTFRTARVSHHLLTNAQVIQIFTRAQVTVDAEIGSPGTVKVIPAEVSTIHRHELE